MRLSGWQRLGIVATTAWVLSTFGYAFWLHVDEKVSYPKTVYRLCLETAPTLDDPRCVKLHEDTRKRFAEIPFYWPNPTIIAIAPIVPFWLAAWMLLVTVRWIYRGFVPRSSSPRLS